MKQLAGTASIVAVTLFVEALALFAVLVMITEKVRSATVDTEVPWSFLGMPVFLAFRTDDRIGVVPQWGLLVLIGVPILIGMTAIVIASGRALLSYRPQLSR